MKEWQQKRAAVLTNPAHEKSSRHQVTPHGAVQQRFVLYGANRFTPQKCFGFFCEKKRTFYL